MYPGIWIALVLLAIGKLTQNVELMAGFVGALLAAAMIGFAMLWVGLKAWKAVR